MAGLAARREPAGELGLDARRRSAGPGPSRIAPRARSPCRRTRARGAASPRPRASGGSAGRCPGRRRVAAQPLVGQLRRARPAAATTVRSAPERAEPVMAGGARFAGAGLAGGGRRRAVAHIAHASVCVRLPESTPPVWDAAVQAPAAPRADGRPGRVARVAPGEVIALGPGEREAVTDRRASAEQGRSRRTHRGRLRRGARGRRPGSLRVRDEDGRGVHGAHRVRVRHVGLVAAAAVEPDRGPRARRGAAEHRRAGRVARDSLRAASDPTVPGVVRAPPPSSVVPAGQVAIARAA